MKPGMLADGNVLIMHLIFFFLPSYENCGCYGNKNSQIVAKTYGSQDNSKTIQASLMKLGIWRGGNVMIMQVIFICLYVKAVVAM